METPLLFAGLRCVARYIVLPFVLPLLGVTTGATRCTDTPVTVGQLGDPEHAAVMPPGLGPMPSRTPRPRL